MTIGKKSALIRRHPLIFVLLTLVILPRVIPDSVSAVCEFSLIDNNKLYSYSLASPIPKFPHGALSEDGFYKVAVNETVLWFQGCGGTSHCGMGCSALVSNSLGGYHVCTTVGRPSSMTIDLVDKKTPHAGVIVKMSTGPKRNCSLSVSVICDSNEVQAPSTLEQVGICDYATQLRHSAGCAKIVPAHGKGLGWFGTIITIILCLFGAYLLGGTIYRFFFLHIRGIDIIPNLEFWVSLPHRVQSLFMSLVRRFRGPSESYRSSYSPVNF